MINTVNHLQNAKEIGGTDSTPPLATMVLVAIKIGCIKSNAKPGVLKLISFTTIELKFILCLYLDFLLNYKSLDTT